MASCFHCGGNLIWQNDFSYEDYCIDDREGIVHVCVCDKCGAYHEIYVDIPTEEQNEN